MTTAWAATRLAHFPVNDLSAAVIDLFSVYHPAAPADLGRLAVLERQVTLDVAANDLTAAADSLAKANAVWARLEPSVLIHNGADVATQFETQPCDARNSLDGQGWLDVDS